MMFYFEGGHAMPQTVTGHSFQTFIFDPMLVYM